MIEPDLHPPDPPEEPIDSSLMDDDPLEPEPTEDDLDRWAWMAEAATWDRVRGE